MKFLKQYLDFYIDTSIHVAFAVLALVKISALDLNSSSNSNLDFFIFFGTIFGYNFLKYFEVFWKRIFTFKKKYSIILVSLIALFGMIFCYCQLEMKFQIEFFKIGFLIAIYPFIRKYGFLKILVVAFCVSYITVFIPSLLNFKFIYFIQRFLLIFCFLIPLEICDLETDSQTIITLPKLIGIQNLKILGYLLLVVCYFLKLNFVIAIVIALAIFFSNSKRSHYYTSFWVESIPIFWYFVYLFTK